MTELLVDAVRAVRRIAAGRALDGALVLLRLGRRLTPRAAATLRLVREEEAR